MTNLKNNSLNLYSSLIPLFLTIFIDAIGLGLIFPIFTPLFIKNSQYLFEIGATENYRYFIYGIVLASYPFAMFFGAPCLGAASDKYGRKPVLISLLLGNSFGLILTAIGISLLSLPIIVFGRIISGLTAGSLPIAQAAIIDISNENNKSSHMSIITAANALGFAVGPFLGGMFSNSNLSSLLTPATPFFLVSILPLLTMFLIIKFFHETYQPNKDKSITLYSSIANIYYAFQIKNTRKPLLIYSFFLLGYFEFFNYLSIFASQVYQFNDIEISYFLTYFSIWFAIAFIFIIPWLSKKILLEKSLLSALLIQPLVVLIMLLFVNKFVGWLLLAPMAVSIAITYVALLTILSNKTESEHQGRIMGIATSMSALAWGFAPIFSGYLEGISVTAPMILATFILTISLLLFFRYRQTERVALK